MTPRLKSPRSAGAIFIRADVAHPAEVKAMVEETLRTFGGLNILYNNAGVPMHAMP